MSRKLSKKRRERNLIVDAYTGVVNPEKIGKVLSGTQAVFAVLVGIKVPIGISEIAKRFARSKSGIAAYTTYCASRFYKGATIEAYAKARSGKLINWGLGKSASYPHTLPIIESNELGGYSLSAFGVEEVGTTLDIVA